MLFVLVTEFAPHIVVERRGVGRADRRHARVELEGLAGVVPIPAQETAVEPAHRPPAVAQQLLAEPARLDAEVGVLHPSGVQPGEARRFRGDARSLGGREFRAPRERRPVVLVSEAPRLGEQVVETRPFLRERAVIPGRRGVGRKESEVREIVSFPEPDLAEVQDGGHEQHAVEGDAGAIDQVAAQTGGARRAVTLPDQVERGSPPLVPGQVQPDELADAADVLLQAPELLAVGLGLRAAVPGSHRVDEDQVGEVEPGGLVVHERVGGRRQAAVFQHLHPPGAERAQVEPDRRRARAAVERESERTVRGSAVAVGGVGDVEDLALRFTGVRTDRQRAGRSGVTERSSPYHDLVPGLDGAGFAFRRGTRLRRLALRREGGGPGHRAGEQDGQREPRRRARPRSGRAKRRSRNGLGELSQGAPPGGFRPTTAERWSRGLSPRAGSPTIRPTGPSPSRAVFVT